MSNGKVDKLIEILNKIDPENLTPGQADSPPKDEYEIECKKLLDYIDNNLDKLTQGSLKIEINNVWEEYFNKKCDKVELLSQSILEEVKTWRAET